MSARKKENKVSIGKKERKKEEKGCVGACVCLSSFPSQRAAAPSKPGASCGPWSANPAVLPATGTATGAKGQPMFGRAGGRVGRRVGRYARNVRGASNSGLA
jgi:hypothetical protein